MIWLRLIWSSGSKNWLFEEEQGGGKAGEDKLGVEHAVTKMSTFFDFDSLMDFFDFFASWWDEATMSSLPKVEILIQNLISFWWITVILSKKWDFLSASYSCSRFYIFKILLLFLFFRDLSNWNNFILLEQFYSFGITLFFWNNFILLE